jgi:hypothetical protein
LTFELVHRLAHHGARHAMHLGQALLGGQAVARRERAAVDLLLHQRGQAVGQARGLQLLRGGARGKYRN